METTLAQSPRADDSLSRSPEEQQVQAQGVDATDVELSLPSQQPPRMEEELACVATASAAHNTYTSNVQKRSTYPTDPNDVAVLCCHAQDIGADGFLD